MEASLAAVLCGRGVPGNAAPLPSRGWSRYPSACPGFCDQLDPATPVLVTAQGLLVYFQRNEVHDLITAIAQRLPRSSFVFDVVPDKMLELARKMPGRERDQAVELWSWLFSPEERAAIGEIRGVAGITDLVPPRALGMVPVTLRAVRRLPRRVRYALPVFPVLQVRFR